MLKAYIVPINADNQYYYTEIKKHLKHDNHIFTWCCSIFTCIFRCKFKFTP